MARLTFAAVALLVVLLQITVYGTGATPLLAAHQSTDPIPGIPGTPLLGDFWRPPIVKINYFGGRVLWKPIHVYFIWYGTWTEAQKEVVRAATKSLTPKERIREHPNLSDLWSAVTEYYQELPGEERKYASNDVSIAGEVDDHYSFGHRVSTDMSVPFLLSHVGRDLPKDLDQGVYFIFTSGDVKFTDPPEDLRFCGLHDQLCIDPTKEGTTFCDEDLNQIVWSFVPWPSEQGSFPLCNLFSRNSVFQLPPPNRLVDPTGALDSLIIGFLHEFLELTVDPLVTTHPGWLVDLTENSEASDLCAYTFIAGDWFYCGLPDIYPDFPGVINSSVTPVGCSSVFYHPKTLTEPRSNTTFNIYGIDGSKFIVQQFWSLASRGCVLQPEASCAGRPVVLSKGKGTITRGRFFRGVGIQHYTPGQSCTWKISVPGAKRIHLTFVEVALGFDDKDYVTVADSDHIKTKVTGFGKNIKVTVTGNEANIHFVTYDRRAPYPSAAGFNMHYKAEK